MIEGSFPKIKEFYAQSGDEIQINLGYFNPALPADEPVTVKATHEGHGILTPKEAETGNDEFPGATLDFFQPEPTNTDLIRLQFTHPSVNKPLSGQLTVITLPENPCP